MTKQVVVQSAQVEAAKAALARNEARGRPTDEATRRLAAATTVSSTGPTNRERQAAEPSQ